jgi:Family of unknown function (DUF6065)
MAPPSKDRPRGRVTIVIEDRSETTPVIEFGSISSPHAPTTVASEERATLANDLSLIAYDVGPRLEERIVAASRRRDWMDATTQSFAYSCLPLVIANQHGWFLLCPCRIKLIWNGGIALDAITIEYPPNEARRFASSHFGEGILTFHMDYIFRTPPGINLHIRGPANLPKDGIAPLEGIIETDWSETSFTMNWKLTRAHHEVVFEENEPFAMIAPVVRGELERYRPAIHPIAANAELEAGYRAWSQSRDSFNADLKIEGSDAQKMRRQRHYIRGQTVTQRRAGVHQTSLDLAEFVDKRKP